MSYHSWLVLARLKTVLSFFLFSLCFFSLCPLFLCGSFSPGASLQVFPPDVHLFGARARQTLVVQATFPDGITRDVTSQSAMKLVNPALCKLEQNQLVPLADGVTELIVAHGEHSVKVPITVKDAKVDPPDQLQARRDAGLHAGRLQHRELPRRGPRQGRLPAVALRLRSRRRPLPPDPRDGRPPDQPGRARSDSLLLEKSIGTVPHTGGKRFEADSDATTRRSIRWIEAGAPDDAATLPPGRAVDLYPEQAVLDGKGATQQIDRAGQLLRRHRPRRHQPGRLPHQQRQRPRAVIPDGLVTAGERGEAFVMARFATYTVGSQFIVFPRVCKFDVPQRRPRPTTSISWSPTSCKKLRIAPSELCTDDDLPPPGLPRHHRPAADRRTSTSVSWPSTTPDKRAKLVDRAARAQGVLRDLGEQVGRAAADPLDASRSATRRCSSTTTGCSERISKNMPHGPDGAGAARRQRRHVQEPGHELTTRRNRDPEAHRERGPGLHGHAHPVCPVPQPSLRPLDDGRLLRLRRVLRADRPQGGRRLPRDDRLQHRRRRGDATRSAAAS